MDTAAIFRCLDCLEERKFGDCCDNRLYRPLLNCGICKRPTRHRFVRIVPEVIPIQPPTQAPPALVLVK